MKKFDITEAYIVIPNKKIPIPEKAIDELFKLLDEAEVIYAERVNEDGYDYEIKLKTDIACSIHPETEQQIIDAVAQYLHDFFHNTIKVIHRYDGEVATNYWENDIEHIYVRKGRISYFLQKFMPEANINVNEITEIVIENYDVPHV